MASDPLRFSLLVVPVGADVPDVQLTPEESEIYDIEIEEPDLIAGASGATIVSVAPKDGEWSSNDSGFFTIKGENSNGYKFVHHWLEFGPDVDPPWFLDPRGTAFGRRVPTERSESRSGQSGRRPGSPTRVNPSEGGGGGGDSDAVKIIFRVTKTPNMSGSCDWVLRVAYRFTLPAAETYESATLYTGFELLSITASYAPPATGSVEVAFLMATANLAACESNDLYTRRPQDFGLPRGYPFRARLDIKRAGKPVKKGPIGQKPGVIVYGTGDY